MHHPLVEIGVLLPQGASEWASPTFNTPKKESRVNWVSDVWEFNKVVKRKPYSLPIIWDMLQRCKGYKLQLSLTSQCNIIPLSLTISQSTYAPLQHLLVNSNTIDYLWVLNAPLIMLRKSWKIASLMLKTQVSTLMTLCFLPFLGWPYGTTAHHINLTAGEWVHS